jgi:hypothetical protein
MRVATVASKSGYSVSKKVNQISPVDNSNYQSGFFFFGSSCQNKTFYFIKEQNTASNCKNKKKPIIFIVDNQLHFDLLILIFDTFAPIFSRKTTS